MPEMQNSKLNKLRTVLSVLLLIFTIFSVTFTAAEAGHASRCIEDNCPICFVIQIAKTNLEVLIFTLAVSAVFHHFEKSEKLTLSSIYNTNISNSLFSLKTRLND